MGVTAYTLGMRHAFDADHIGVIVATWAIALAVWRFGRIEQRWSARPQRG